ITSNVFLYGGDLGGDGSVGNITQSFVFADSLAPYVLLNAATVTLNTKTTYTTSIRLDGCDTLNATGNLQLNGGMLSASIVGSFSIPTGTVYPIIQSSGTISGTFNGLADGNLLLIGGLEFRINYTTSAVTLTRVQAHYGTSAPASVNAGSPFNLTVS